MNFKEILNKLKLSEKHRIKLKEALTTVNYKVRNGWCWCREHFPKEKFAKVFAAMSAGAIAAYSAVARASMKNQKIRQWVTDTKAKWEPQWQQIKGALPQRFPRTAEEWKNFRPQELAESLTKIFKQGSLGSYFKYGAIIAAAYFLADTAALFTGYLVPDAPPVPAPVFKAKADKKRSVEEFASIISRNIFNSKGIIPEESRFADPNGPARKSTLPLNLVGTIVLADENKSIATIEDKGVNKILPVRVNENMEGKITVKKIEHLKVTFVNNASGTLEYIEIPETQLLGISVKSNSAVSKEGIYSDSENHFNVKKTELDKAFSNLNEVLTQAHAIPAMENGAMIGFKITKIKPGSVYTKLGINENDIITAVNGEPMTDPGKAFQLMNELKSGSGHLEISFKSADGKVRTHSYDIQ